MGATIDRIGEQLIRAREHQPITTNLPTGIGVVKGHMVSAEIVDAEIAAAIVISQKERIIPKLLASLRNKPDIDNPIRTNG